MIKKCIENANFEDTGFHYNLSLMAVPDQLCIWGEENRPEEK